MHNPLKIETIDARRRLVSKGYQKQEVPMNWKALFDVFMQAYRQLYKARLKSAMVLLKEGFWIDVFA